ncbi:MAG: DOPA 4,5-dioxygenase family protein, partial [Candidatus Binatia bacterium]
MNEPSAPHHAHVYYEPRTRAVAERLHQQLDAMRANGVLTSLLFVGAMRDKSVGPHPKPQFEVHFLAAALTVVIPLLSSSGLTVLVHPLTQDDLADHT